MRITPERPGRVGASDAAPATQPRRNLAEVLASFHDVYSPRIVARVNDYDVKVAHTDGEHVWHAHADTDEFFLVLDGRFDIALRGDDGAETTVTLHEGDVFVVPRGVEHKPSSPGGAILMFEPTGTASTGDRHEGQIPTHVDTTTGHALVGGTGSAASSAAQRPRAVDT
jgi:mannose-6-phosphate isomerase-like protein (cupin superfamily)